MNLPRPDTATPHLADVVPSVLAAMGGDAHRSLRVSVGWSSTDADVDRLLDALPRVLDGLRSLRS